MTLSPAPGESTTLPTAALISCALGAVAVVAGCLLLWPPSYPMADLRVYLAAVRALTAGEDIYAAHLAYPGMELGFTYPPFAAVVLLPLGLSEQFARLTMTALSAVALLTVGQLTVRSLRPAWSPRRTLAAGLLCGAAGLAFEPVRATFGLGQLNLILMALVMLDLLGPVPPRYRGVLVGIAAGIKLTPALFIVFLLLTGRYRAAATAAAATAGSLLVGWLVMPAPSVQYWTSLVFDPGRPGPAHYIANQSLRGSIARLGDGWAGAGPFWLATALATATAGLFIARRLDEHGRRLDAVVLTAFTALLVSPVSWTNHWVWVVPASAMLCAWSLGDPRRPETTRIRWTARRAGFAATAGWVAVVTIGLPWLAPFKDDREFNHTLPEALIGNSYLLAGLALVLAALRRQQHRECGQASTSEALRR